MVNATDQYGNPVAPTQPGFNGMPPGVSSIPSIGGLFQQQQQQPQSYIQPISSGNVGAVPAQYAAIMASTNPEHKAIQDQLRAQFGAGQGPLSTFPGGTSGATPQAAAPQQAGQSPSGPSAYEQYLASRQAAVNQTAARMPSDTGGGGSSFGGAPSATPNAGVLSGQGTGNMSPAAQGSATPQFNVSGAGSFPNTPVTTYAQPQQQQMAQPGGGVLQMQQQSPQDALSAYHNTAGYQNLNAPGAYQASPGYQYAMGEAMRNAQGNASARGLLESGSALRGFNTAVQGVAQQDYGNWWNRQNSAFNDYQNRLAGLAGGNVGGDQAYNLGQSQAANTMATGGNVGGLLGNQGTAGFGGMMNTGGAQGQNMTQAGAQQAQINSANASTQLAGAVYNRGLF